MGAQGTAILDFGAFPGASDASVAVTGQAAITGTSLVEAWLRPVDTADHTADEHLVVEMTVRAHSIVVGTGFTITGVNANQLNEPLGNVEAVPFAASAVGQPGTARTQARSSVGGVGTRIAGQWTVAWVWN